MSSEEKIYRWATEIHALCPESAPLTKADISKIYKGPMKQILDSMCKHVRSTEDVQKIRNYMNQQKVKELLERRAAAELLAKKLETENAGLLEKSLKLAAKNAQLNSSLMEAQRKASLLRACAVFCQDQRQASQGLSAKAKHLGKKLSPSVNEATNVTPSFSFNPNLSKLESVLKSETRKLLEAISSKDGCEEVTSDILRMVSKYSGEDRWNVLLELSAELRAKAEELSQSVDLERDAKMLSQELADAEGGVVAPLQRHLDCLTLAHAQLVLQSRRKVKEVHQLEQRLRSLLANNPEAATEAEAAMREAQATQLRKDIRQLILQDRQEQNQHLETARTILQIKTFSQETERRKDEIVCLLGLMEDAARLTEQLHDETLARTQAQEVQLEPLLQVAGLQRSTLGLLSQHPLGTVLDNQQHPGDSELPFDGSSYCLATDWAYKRARLRVLQANLENQDDNNEKVSKDLMGSCVNVREHVDRLEEQLRSLQLEFAKEQGDLPQQLAEHLRVWREQPVQTALRRDQASVVAGMTLQQWTELVQEEEVYIDSENSVCTDSS